MLTRYSIELNHAWCKACRICVDFCPKKVFGVNESGRAVVVNIEKCVGCTLCELWCPDFAIKVEGSEQSGEAS